ncbi:MAG TPA: class I SAM-dependent methyltransferase [Capsulimonadaceae bacterium]|jgi:predicted O-methyltransferase YrrM
MNVLSLITSHDVSARYYRAIIEAENVLRGNFDRLPEPIRSALAELEQLDNDWELNDIPVDEHHYGRIPGETSIRLWSVPRSTGELLSFLVMLSGARTILEVGTSAGYSTLWLAAGAQVTGGHVYTYDVFKQKIQLANHYVERAGVEDTVTITEADGIDAITHWDAANPIDFAFLDAHKEDYCRTLQQLLPKMRKLGLIIVDNAGNYRHLMADFIQRIEAGEDVVNHYLDVDGGLMLLVKL